MKSKEIIDSLRVIAEDLTPVGSARVAAAIVYRGSIISVGVNSLKTDPMQARFSKNIHAIHLHAEVSAIKKALKLLTLSELKKSSLYIVRRRLINGIMRDGLAKPCCGCQRAIETYGIQNVQFTVDSV